MNIFDDDMPPLHLLFDADAMRDTGRHITNLLFAELSFTIQRRAVHPKLPGMPGLIRSPKMTLDKSQ